MSNEIFILSKRKRKIFSNIFFTIKISATQKKYSKLYEFFGQEKSEEKLSGKYRQSLQLIKENSPSYNYEVNNTFQFFFNKIEDKFCNWIFWIYNLFPKEPWTDIFYIDGIKPNESDFIPFQEQESTNFHCNIGLEIKKSDVEPLVILMVRQLQTYVSKISNLLEIIRVSKKIC